MSSYYLLYTREKSHLLKVFKAWIKGQDVCVKPQLTRLHKTHFSGLFSQVSQQCNYPHWRKSQCLRGGPQVQGNWGSFWGTCSVFSNCRSNNLWDSKCGHFLCTDNESFICFTGTGQWHHESGNLCTLLQPLQGEETKYIFPIRWYERY